MKRGADGAVLQPAASGCYVALVEPDERQFNVLLERRNFDFDHYISTGTALVNGAQLPPDGKDAAHAPGAKRFAEVCANKCRFLKLSDDLTRLEVSLEQRASDLDVEVTPELAKVFGEVRGFFEDSINFHSLHRSRARSHAQRAKSPQPSARESGATSRDAECVPDEAAFADFDSGSADNGGPVEEKDITMISAVEKNDDGVGGDAGGKPDIEPLGPTTPTKPHKSLEDMLGAESRPKKKARTTRTTEDVAAHRQHPDSPPQPKKQLSQDGSANENESSKDDFEVLVCKDAFFAGNLELALDADGQVVGKLAQDQPKSYNLKGRSDPRIIAYLEGQTFQKGCSQLEEKICFPFRASSHDLVGFLDPAIMTPPPAWDLWVVKLACLRKELCGSGTIVGGRDGLIGHSITGEGEKIRCNAMRSAKAYAFMPTDQKAAAFFRDEGERLDYLKMCWVIRVDAQSKQLIPASLGLLNMKARKLRNWGWTCLSKDLGGDQEESYDSRLAI